MEGPGERFRDVVEAVSAVEQWHVVVTDVVEHQRERDENHGEVVGTQSAQHDQGDEHREGRSGEPPEDQVHRERQAEPENVVLARPGRVGQAERPGHVGADRHEPDSRRSSKSLFRRTGC